MDNFLNWIMANWPEIIAFFGASGLGVFGGKKLIDQRQDKSITAIKKRLDEMDKLISNVQTDLALNKQGDEFTKQILAEIKKGQDEMKTLLMEIVTGKIKLK